MFGRQLTLALALALTVMPGCTCNGGGPGQPDTGTVCATACSEGTYCCAKTATCEPEQRKCANLQTCGAGDLVYPAPPYMDDKTCEPILLQCTCSATPMVGRFSALAASAGTLMASAYESRYGDLVLASIKTDSLDAAPTLEIIDGVPSAAPSNDSSWRGGVAEPGDDVGHDTDIVVGINGEPMIAYHDVTHRSLKFAMRWNGQWTAQPVDEPRDDHEVVGRYASMILVEGKPAIVYLALDVAAADGGSNSELRWAAASGAAPTGTADWSRTVIEARPMVVPGDGKVAEIPVASGLWPAAVRTSAGPLVVYYDHTAGRLVGAGLQSGAWTIKALAGGAPEDLGAFPAAACDGGDLVHVTFQDAARLQLRYLQVDAETLAADAPELIDDGVRADGAHPVGADSAVVLDSAGNVRVVYQDALKSDLLAARRTAPGQWTPNIGGDPDLGRRVEGGPRAYGFYSDLVVEGGEVYGSTFYYDPPAKPNGGLSFFKLP